MWRKTQDKARAEKRDDIDHPIILGDINNGAMHSSSQHALKARVEKYLTFAGGDFFTKKLPHFKIRHQIESETLISLTI